MNAEVNDIGAFLKVTKGINPANTNTTVNGAAIDRVDYASCGL